MMSSSSSQGYHENSESFHFLSRITGCSFPVWRAAAREGLRGEVGAALVMLVALCSCPEYALDDWRVRDDLRTVAHHFAMFATPARVPPRELFALMGVTENAARALLVRPALAVEHFSLLYAPFAELVPLTSLRIA